MFIHETLDKLKWFKYFLYKYIGKLFTQQIEFYMFELRENTC